MSREAGFAECTVPQPRTASLCLHFFGECFPYFTHRRQGQGGWVTSSGRARESKREKRPEWESRSFVS